MLIYLCECVCLCVCACVYVCALCIHMHHRDQGTICRTRFSPPPVWVPGFEFMPLTLASSPYPLSPVPGPQKDVFNDQCNKD